MFSVHDIHNTPSILIVHTQTLNSVLKRDLMKEDGVAGVGGRFCQSDGHVRGRGVTNLSSRKLTQPKKQVARISDCKIQYLCILSHLIVMII